MTINIWTAGQELLYCGTGQEEEGLSSIRDGYVNVLEDEDMDVMYHIFNKGSDVLFRDSQDYVFFCNRFGVLSYLHNMRPLALTVMSTHFHAIVEPVVDSDLDEFFTALRRAYNTYITKKHKCSPACLRSISFIEISDRVMAKSEILYVLKNPVHHYVSEYAMSYEYGSVSHLFMHKTTPKPYLEAYEASLTPMGKLPIKLKRELASKAEIPDTWKVHKNGLIAFESYINEKRAMALWDNKVKMFMFDILKNQTDSSKAIIQDDILDFRSGGMSDMEVCSIIDGFALENGYGSFYQLPSSLIDSLVRMLKRRGLPPDQISRCLCQNH